MTEEPADLPTVPDEITGDAPVVSLAPADDTNADLLPFPVVAIGASAGGLEACIELLRGLPADTGMSFVFISHLSSEHKSHLTEIFSRHTTMPVREIADGLQCAPNFVYVLPPNARASISGGRLQLDPRPEDERVQRPIDRFFRSLASDQKVRAIGVILSGSDADGALGLRAIKGEGGIAIVQTPESARFSEMPLNGISADHVDLILPPSGIGKELARLAEQFANPELRSLEEGRLEQEEEQYISKLFSLLRGVSGLDFRNYKSTTFRRRLGRRMMLKHIESLPEYLRYLQARPDELRSLQEDALIHVTRFFRDPEVFDALKEKILPKLFEDRPADQVRIWSAGCATGEETYSLAMAVLEFLAGQPVEPSIQVFGTDASEDSIEKARIGVYPDSISEEVSPERLRRFFVKSDRGYQISKRVRDLCIFARQNLCVDPPFSRLDLVACRNVLIYLNADIQNRIITTFNYSLKAKGLLLLGASESLRDHADLFKPADHKHKVYLKSSELPNVPMSLLPDLQLLGKHPSSAQTFGQEGWGELELQRATDRIILTRHSPPGVVVNDKMEVLQVRGRVAPYLQIAAGTPSLNILRMANEALGPTLRDALERTMHNDLPVQVEGAQIREGDGFRDVTLEVVPVHSTHVRPRCYLVLFLADGMQNSAALEKFYGERSPIAESSDENKREILQLRQDLSSTRHYLQSLIEERDARNQELTSAYEEMQSSNEELQSTNEELQTAKEELQSTNEELQTVNEEMRDRNAALLQASNDLANLFNSVNIPVVILGIDLTVRHFTPPTERLMFLRAADIGRPIREIRLNLKLEAIEPLLIEVLETLGTKEVEVQDLKDRWHILRIRPYRTADNKIEGLVLVLLDVDHLRRGEEAMREARDFAQCVLESVRIPLVVLQEDLRVRKVNASFCALTQMGTEELEHRSFPELAKFLWNLEQMPAISERAWQNPGAVVDFEHKDGKGRVLRFSVQAIQDGSPMLLITIEDITSRKEFEERVKQEKERLLGEVQTTTRALGRTQEELRALAGSLFTSQEDERRRVARELHDDISQKLALLEIQAREYRKTLPDEISDVKTQVKAWAEKAGKLSEDVRQLSHALHPSVLDDLGLTPALRQMVEDFGAREGMPTTFDAVAVPGTLSRDAATSLYRIAQEALRNVSKYAGKTHVRVTLMGTENGVRLTVRDLGRGFDSGEKAQGSLGLLSMEERARLVGGTFRVESEINAGTTVEVEVPTPSE